MYVCRPHVGLFGTFWVQLGWFDLTVFRLVTSAGEEGSAYLEVVCELLHLPLHTPPTRTNPYNLMPSALNS